MTRGDSKDPTHATSTTDTTTNQSTRTSTLPHPNPGRILHRGADPRRQQRLFYLLLVLPPHHHEPHRGGPGTYHPLAAGRAGGLGPGRCAVRDGPVQTGGEGKEGGELGNCGSLRMSVALFGVCIWDMGIADTCLPIHMYTPQANSSSNAAAVGGGLIRNTGGGVNTSAYTLVDREVGAWTDKYGVLFVDSPVGTGYSVAGACVRACAGVCWPGMWVKQMNDEMDDTHIPSCHLTFPPTPTHQHPPPPTPRRRNKSPPTCTDSSRASTANTPNSSTAASTSWASPTGATTSPHSHTTSFKRTTPSLPPPCRPPPRPRRRPARHRPL